MKKLNLPKAHLFIFAIYICSLSPLQAQPLKGNSDGSSYSNGIGFRGGLEGGLTFKHFISDGKALEGIISRGWGYGGIRLTILFEIQKPIGSVDGLSWFYGFGGHIGSYNGSYYGYYGYSGTGYYDKHGKWHPTGYRNKYTSIGIDGILGLEYKFNGVPITIGVDIKPYFDILGRSENYTDGAFSIRFVF